MAKNRWNITLKNLPPLFIGLAIFGLGEALLLNQQLETPLGLSSRKVSQSERRYQLGNRLLS